MPNTQDSIELLGTQTLQIAVALTSKIRDAQRSDTAEYPLDLLKILGPIVRVADEINGLSLDAAIRRVTAAGYQVSTNAPMGDGGIPEPVSNLAESDPSSP